MSHYSTITRLDVPDSDRLVAHWYGFTAKTISVADVAARQAIGNLSMSCKLYVTLSNIYVHTFKSKFFCVRLKDRLYKSFHDKTCRLD